MLDNFKLLLLNLMVVLTIRGSHGYSPHLKVIGSKPNFDSDVLPFGVLQEILNLQRTKLRKVPFQRRTKPVTVKIYKDRNVNQYKIERSMRKKINYLGGLNNYYEFASFQNSREHSSLYTSDAYSVLPHGDKEYMLVDKEGDEIVDLKYIKDKGVPRVTKIEPIIIGKTVQEHVFLEVKK